jgi:DNA-binding response OmpR family regulator
MGKVLIVEDDTILGESLKLFLEAHGYDVDVARSYDEAADLTFENRYDIYVIDVNLLDGSGINLLEDLRIAEDKTPAIFISAIRDVETIAKTFEIGAEDYIKKPFEPEELLVRIKARLGKTGKVSKEFKYKDIVVKDGRVFKNDKEIELGSVQRNILEKLIENKGNVVPKEDLMDLLQNPSDLALRVNISKLKKKLGINIKSVRGLGYTLE